ncbi:hypothetical protein GWI33_014151 [Rhynchophorus ferrugineus]|uniref:Uncharacterized protein n=1 Tax=Rhynchophorus ferrugineus TaxID=354439 RepID=A0A834MCM9_RHYFE|nr:hypothetical protein GWI33_014151 [Rhynchophorus ferrugineus]
MFLDRSLHSIPEDFSSFALNSADSIPQADGNRGETTPEDEHNVEMQEFCRFQNINYITYPSSNWEHSSSEEIMSLDEYFDDINSVLGIEPTMVITLFRMKSFAFRELIWKELHQRKFRYCLGDIQVNISVTSSTDSSDYSTDSDTHENVNELPQPLLWVQNVTTEKPFTVELSI